MEIKILGTGCQRCDSLLRNAQEAVSRVPVLSGTNVEKVLDPAEFYRLGVTVTPALVIDDTIISSGKVLSPEQIEAELLSRTGGA
ncbi:MAG: thioredoxin family protein [Thermodesulfobacteriota bacterium]